MATTFSVPASPKRNTLEINNFLGVDLTNTGSNISETRSPNAPNMIRDVPGKVRKRTGYRTQHDFEGGIVYGAHILKSGTGDSVMGRNVCSSRNVVYGKLKPNEKVYIYANTSVPYGIKTHIQFYYQTEGAVTISPYVTDKTDVTSTLDALNNRTEFYANYTSLKEPFNAFEITNVSSNTIKLNLYEVMIWFEEEVQGFNPSYMSFANISETKFFDIKEDHDVQPLTQTVQGSTNQMETFVFNINPNGLPNLLLANYNLMLSSFNGVLEELEIAYEAEQNDGTTTVINEIPPYLYYKDYQLSGYQVLSVLDPSYNHALYDPTISKITKLIIRVKVTNTTAWDCTVAISDIHLREIALKTDFSKEDYIRLIHVGTTMWLENNGVYSVVYENMNENKSVSFQNERKLYILDGGGYYLFDSDELSFIKLSEQIPTAYDNSENTVYVPTLTILKDPTGGGQPYEDINLLTPAFMETFYVSKENDTVTSFQLSRNDLDTTEVRVWVLDSAGVWQKKTETVDFNVNRSDGIVQFTYAPGQSPITGEPNVMVLAYKTTEGYADRINKCTFGTLFGVNGAADRVFVSGNQDYINYDWHSGQYLFNYFTDTSYAKLGSDASAIVGYSIVQNYLATHKDEYDPTQSVIIREGDLIATGETSVDGVTIYDEEPAFKIINTLQGAGAISKNSFATLQTEPVFLTRSGIYAITPQDMTGERYAQNRSFFLNGALLEERNLEDAHAVAYNDMYLLFINTRVYVLDGLQATGSEKGEPYSSRQYAGFLLTNIPATYAWVEDNVLWFGTADGKICKFATDKEALTSYNDDGYPIEAWWETSDLDGHLFYKKKTFRYIAVRVKSNIMTHATIYAKQRGIWTLVKRSKDLSNAVFAFSTLVFSKLTFNNDTSDPVISSKLRVKKVDKSRFKIENVELNEPFGIQNLALEYIESGNYKG